MSYYQIPNLDDNQQHLIGLSRRGEGVRMNNIALPCLFCKHCAAIYKNSRNEAIKVQCELYSTPMREFECFEKDPLINIE